MAMLWGGMWQVRASAPLPASVADRVNDGLEMGSPPEATSDERTKRALERVFRRAGLPLFISGYTAAEDVFTRALPFLVVVFVVLVLSALNLQWGFWANVGAFVGGLAILVVGFGVLNVARGRPFASVPTRVGLPELATFVLVPSLLPLVFGGQVVSAAVTAGALVLLLALVYLVIGFGLLSILRWAGARLFRMLAGSLRTLVRAIPLVLFFSLLLFLTQELWQVLAAAPRPFIGAMAVLIMGVGALFVLARIPREVTTLEEDLGGGAPSLSRAQRANVGLVVFVSQALQILFVGLGVAAFFMAFGMLTVSPAVLNEWIGNSGTMLATFSLFGHEVVITQELLRVAGAIGAFSGLYYAISTLIDPSYHEEFLGDITHEMRPVFEARVEYLQLTA